MAETVVAGTYAPNAPEAAELPVSGFQAREAVPDEVGRQLAKLNRYAVVSRNWGAVREYLQQYPDLAAVLPAICEEARQEFEPSGQLALELYRDPEVQDEYLTLYIRQNHYLADFMARIERLTDRFREQIDHASGYLLLTSDFSPPRGGDVL